MNILSSFIHPCVISNLSFYFVEQKRQYFEGSFSCFGQAPNQNTVQCMHTKTTSTSNIMMFSHVRTNEV